MASSRPYGQAFEDSLTRKSERIDILLLLHALAVFAAWLAGMAAEADGYQRRLTPFAINRRLYSLVRLGWEALTQGLAGLREKRTFAMGDGAMGEAFTAFSDPQPAKEKPCVTGRSDLIGRGR